MFLISQFSIQFSINVLNSQSMFLNSMFNVQCSTLRYHGPNFFATLLNKNYQLLFSGGRTAHQIRIAYASQTFVPGTLTFFQAFHTNTHCCAYLHDRYLESRFVRPNDLISNFCTLSSSVYIEYMNGVNHKRRLFLKELIKEHVM